MYNIIALTVCARRFSGNFSSIKYVFVLILFLDVKDVDFLRQIIYSVRNFFSRLIYTTCTGHFITFHTMLLVVFCQLD